VDQAQANLDRVRATSPYDVLAAQAAVDQAQATVEKLLAPSEFDVLAAQAAAEQAEAALEKSRRSLGFDVETAQAQLDQSLASVDLKRAGPAVQDLAVAQAQVDVAQAQLDQAKWSLTNTTLVAPFAGIVAAVNTGPGEVVGANNPVVTVVDRRSMRADVVVDEADVARLKPGQPATLAFDLAPGRTARGHVAGVVPQPNAQQGLVSYVVQIALEGTSELDLLPGMSTQAQIVTDSRQSTLLVPSRAVHGTATGTATGKERTVDVLGPDGRSATRTVKTGLAADQLTEVLDGLREGDRVVVPAGFPK